MKIMMVYETIEVRSECFDNYSDWTIENGEFDEIIEKYKVKSSNKNNYAHYTIMKKYYTMNHELIGYGSKVMVASGVVFD